MKRRYITFMRIIHTGVVNFIRNASLAIAAMAVMIVTLTIVLFSLIANVTLGHTVSQITNKVDVSVFLKDSVTPAEANTLVGELRKLPNAQTVTYLSKDQVLKNFQKANATNVSLLTASNETANPLPATIHVKPRDINQIKSIQTFLVQPKIAALQSDPSSYNDKLKEAIDNIGHSATILRQIGIITVAVFAVVSALIIFNTIQMAIFNRRDEIQIMRLLGASTNYIRGPFIVESIIYGILSAIVSVLIVNSVFVASSTTLQASTLGLLDIGYATTFFDSHFWLFLTLQLGVGIVIGAISSFIATRRYLRFKVR